MPVYFFTYDLTKKKPEFDYEVLWNELKRLDGHRTQFSAWLINVDNTPKELLDHIRQFVHDDDRLWLVRLTIKDGKRQWTYDKAMAGTNKWLENNPVT